MIGKPVVGIVMGSDSDMEVMQRCMEQLESLEIPFEVRIISAHRTPDVAHEYGAMAAKRGLKVLIAAAGMSAALGGVLASKSTLPVIGVPVNSGPLNGIDAALSTMQMPPGVPVACMSPAWA
jgi:phosphoribosylaminoimidazole carboxylase PurE protein